MQGRSRSFPEGWNSFAILLQITSQFITGKTSIFLHSNQEAKPRRITVGLCYRKNQSRNILQTIIQHLIVGATGCYNLIQFIQLSTTNSGLHIRNLQIEAKVTVHILMVVALRQFTKLTGETHTASVVHT